MPDFLKEIESPEFISYFKEKFCNSFRQEPSVEVANSWSAEIGYLKGTLNGVSGSIILECWILGRGE